MKRFILLLLVISLSLVSCRKILFRVLARSFAAELWEDRAQGTSCQPSLSDETIDNDEITYSENHMLCIDLTMDPADFQIMRNESRFGPSVLEKDGVTVTQMCLDYVLQCDVPFPSEYNWYVADVNVDGIKLTDVGIRKKGFLGSIFSEAPSMIINTDRLISDQKIANVNRITLNNNSEDASRVIQCLSYKIVELAGYPAPRCNMANVSVNDEDLGVYAHLEAVNEDFLSKSFGNNTGHLYEGQLVDFVSDWRLRWEPKTANTDELSVPVLYLASVLSEASDDALEDILNDHLNIENYITFWALEVLLGHNDGYAVNRNNFFVYFDPNDNDRATFVPWGLNYFRQDEKDTTALKHYVKAEIPRRFSRIQSLNDRMHLELQHLLDEVWIEEDLLQLVDHYANQARTAQNDPNYEESLDAVRTWIINRRTVIESMLAEGIPKGKARQPNSCFGL